MTRAPLRGEVWTVDLDPVRGHEHGGQRPSVIVSADRFNRGRSALVVIVPLTSVKKGAVLHVPVSPPEGGLRRASFIKPEDVRSISTDRLGRRVGAVSPVTMRTLAERLSDLLEL